MDGLWLTAGAGVAAGLGVAIPVGAIAVLILRVGVVHGLRSAFAAAAAVALVDATYCGIAVATGSALSSTIESWGATPRYVSGAVIVAIGVRQLVIALHGFGRRRAAGEGLAVGRPGAWVVFGRFVALTAINPLTLVYFLALAGAVRTRSDSALAPVVFVAAVGLASLVWQTGLAVAGSTLGASLRPRAVEALGVAASAIIVALGLAVLISTTL